MQGTFGNKASFREASFGDRASLRGATFAGVSFADALFAGRLDADAARFLGATSFRAAEIKGHAGFAGCTWPARPDDGAGAFQGCRFRDVADFQAEGLKAFALFDGAEFKGRLLLADPGREAEDRLFREALHATQQADPADAQLGALMGGLRTLKQAMAAQGDRDREQRFFRHEVQARARKSDEGWVARFAAKVYGLTSDYGASIGRPLLWLVGLVGLFAGIYGAFGIATGILAWGPSLAGVWQALELSAAGSFRPFFLYDTPRPENASFWAELLRRHDGISLAIRLFGTVQSIASILLLFLAGVALRRKFQIG
ncbi:MAG: pentapeptide repeat-containing protein [Sphingomonadaceae bacterium]